MLKIEKTDFRPLDNFPLKWRWMDSRWNKLPNEVLKDIQPFTNEKARELLQYSLKFCNHECLIENKFKNIERIDESSDPLKVSQWLLNQSSDKNQTVIVSWNHHHAVLVRWNVFCDYWNDFCYPASDDVAIWNLSEEWMLMYLHNEEFIFGERAIE